MEQQYVIYLVQQYLSGQLTASQRGELLVWLESEENRVVFVDIALPIMLAGQQRDGYRDEDWDEVLQAVLMSDKTGEDVPVSQEAPVRQMPNYRVRTWWPAAAVIILVAVVGGYWQYVHPGRHQRAPIASNDVAPGGNKAVLTLSGGRQIILDSTAEDTVLTEGSNIVANASGRLAYNPGSGPGTGIVYNTLTTPKGGQYQLVLPDGSQVWLNAASSITYPTAFPGNNRNVTITGEAYFEVTRNPARPFKVKIISPSGDGGEVEVLGTHFNVNAYADEGMVKTTLLEGAVRVTKDAATALLKPGEQVQLTKAGGIKLVHDADTEEAIAWKNGLFQLKSADVPTIMRQLARWYDVEIVYEEGVPDGHISGKVPREMNLSQVLKIFELSGVHFKIEGKKIIVMK